MDSAQKPGVKSTEFALVCAMFATVVANGTQHLNLDPANINMLMAIVGVYTGSRTVSKISGKPPVSGDELITRLREMVAKPPEKP